MAASRYSKRFYDNLNVSFLFYDNKILYINCGVLLSAVDIVCL